MKRPVNVSRLVYFFVALLFFLSPSLSIAGEDTITVAVATNALRPVKEIAALFEKKSSVKVRLVPGSTGRLYAQIVLGAPYDLLLAADDIRPALLEDRGIAKKGSRFVYARGLLAIWSASASFGINERGTDALTEKGIVNIAIANPKTAPYGTAAVEFFKAAGMMADIEDKLVYGESVAQAFAFAKSGNADIAVVALSTLYGEGGEKQLIEAKLYDPIVQEVVLVNAESKEAADFLEFLRSDEAQEIFERYGYLKSE